LLEVKIFFSVFVCNSADDFFKLLVVSRILSLVYPFSDKITEYASEIFVTWVGNERTAVGEHSDEVADSAEVGKCLHLRFHSVALVIEPPARTELNFTGSGSLLEVSEHSSENVVILGIKRIKYSFGKTACVFEVVAGSSSGAKVYDNFVLTEKALWRLKTYLECIGIKADGKLKLDLDKITGKKLIIEVAHEEYKGQVRARISDFKKLAKAETKPAEDDFEEDDDDDWDEA